MDSEFAMEESTDSKFSMDCQFDMDFCNQDIPSNTILASIVANDYPSGTMLTSAFQENFQQNLENLENRRKEINDKMEELFAQLVSKHAKLVDKRKLMNLQMEPEAAQDAAMVLQEALQECEDAQLALQLFQKNKQWESQQHLLHLNEVLNTNRKEKLEAHQELEKVMEEREEVTLACIEARCRLYDSSCDSES